jgi:hypothetical protein
MRRQCSHCGYVIRQSKNEEGPNFCPSCCQLFYPPEYEPIPAWILGVLVFLLAYFQLLVQRNPAAFG